MSSEFGTVKVAVIGGSGLYSLEGLQVLGEVNPETPWGFPSDKLVICQTDAGDKVAFLARHGRGHYLNPSEVPSRANIAALKSIGVEAIISFSAVGSLREEIAPRDFILPSQIIDRTKGIRPSTFFENGVTAHCMFADPFDASLAQLIGEVATTATPSVKFHADRTLVCMEGPAFSTRAESHLYRSWGGDIINMSALPEAKLAREAEIAYQMVCMSTDYDCWRVDEEAVTVAAVMATMQANVVTARDLLVQLLPKVFAALHGGSLKSVSALKGSMRFAIMTAPAKRNPETVEKLKYILPADYF
ncbi:nucleoside phosphorylase domain-containing protein [Zopfochytrium polystomum]|nr:nucleoside phosphorylase domain-containing protein [Zopfochytrium polystomum]